MSADNPGAEALSGMEDAGEAADSAEANAHEAVDSAEVSAAELATLKQQLAAGFRSADRAGLAAAVHGPDFHLWVGQESGWNPRAVSGRTNQGKVNGGLFQFWYGHSWAQPYFSRGNDPRSVFTMPPADQARAVVRHFPHVTAATVRTYAQQIRNGAYRGWG